MECHRSLGVATLVALMATHRALSTPLTSGTRRDGRAAAAQATAPRPEAAQAEVPQRSAPAHPTAKTLA